MRLRNVAVFVLGAVLWCSSGDVLARIDCESATQGGSGRTFTLPPMAIVVGRDAVVGDLIGQWGAPYSDVNAFGCHFTTSSEYANVGIAATPRQTARLNSLIGDDGNSYTVYAATAYNNRGLGYIVRWRMLYEGASTDWQPLTGSFKNAPSYWLGPAGPMATSVQFPTGLEVQVRFVKLSTSLTAGVVTVASGDMVRFNVVGNGTNYYDDDVGASDRKVMSLATSTVTVAAGGTCTTPDVNVVLPTVAASDFSGVASTAGTTLFDLHFNNCPAGLNSVGYYFTPITSIVDPIRGVVALDGTSTASGLGVQLTLADGAALRFGMTNSYPLAYDPGVVGNYTIPLQAAYYQSGTAPVRGGTVRTSVTFTLDYK